MKALKLLTSLSLAMAIVLPLHAEQNPWDVKLPFKSATIAYKSEGSQQGHSTLYIQDYGNKTAKYTQTEMKVFGISQKINDIVITTPDWAYTFDMEEKTGTKTTNPLKYMRAEYNQLSHAEKKKVRRNVGKKGLAMVSSLGGTVEKNAKKILGYQCDKTTAMGITIFTISGSQLPLLTDSNLLGMRIKEAATEIKKGSAPSAKFQLPKGIKVTHDTSSDQVMKEHATSMMQSLLQNQEQTQSSNSNTSEPNKNSQKKDEHSASGSELSSEEEEQIKQMKSMFKMFGQ